jgi:hypothetical protein
VRAIVANMWRGARRVRYLADDEPDPTPEELDAIADQLREEDDRHQDGVTPNVRVVEVRHARRPDEAA